MAKCRFCESEAEPVSELCMCDNCRRTKCRYCGAEAPSGSCERCQREGPRRALLDPDDPRLDGPWWRAYPDRYDWRGNPIPPPDPYAKYRPPR